MYIYEEFAINGIQSKFLSLLLTGKLCKGMTERVRLKRIFTKGEYTVIQRLCGPDVGPDLDPNCLTL